MTHRRYALTATALATAAVIAATPAATARPLASTQAAWTIDCDLPSGYLRGTGPVTTTTPTDPAAPTPNADSRLLLLAYGHRGYEVRDATDQVTASHLDSDWHATRLTKAEQRATLSDPLRCSAWTTITRPATHDSVYYYVGLVAGFVQ